MNDDNQKKNTEIEIPDDTELQTILNVFKTMSDPTRMKIILTIAKKPITVTEIAKALSLEQSTVSHQLRQLKQERLVIGDRSGKQIFYRLADDHVLQIYALTKIHIEEKHALGH
ncbi:transcriptional regulator [Paucilactobacillus vaccinostercus DSM 20634]|uniref:Transcriptional regulator n=1 Tax=Paucilactobacillus vaccinostercus DSM 20634 TaxID=1423813 RepID=A0A0R2ADE6_9LACO|nr:metalloregulator ArsR/SmtB family transcription factor [Paucilactobacillus vaccinostercus]KRM60748.1 transcriptional regulator [Paucilactobacillus vaccinostercus DSM 20634]